MLGFAGIWRIIRRKQVDRKVGLVKDDGYLLAVYEQNTTVLYWTCQMGKHPVIKNMCTLSNDVNYVPVISYLATGLPVTR